MAGPAAADRAMDPPRPRRPGHGRSPDASQDFETEAPLIADQLLGEPMHLVGHSYGALGAMLAAAERLDMCGP